MNFRSNTCFIYGVMFVCTVIFFISCVTVKNAPLNKPFVFENKITVKGDVTKDEKNRLTTELNNYWDDSLRVRKVQQFGFFYVYKSPAVFDTVNIDRTKTYMNAFLNSQGYYYADVADTHTFDTVKNEIRATTNIAINLGKNITIDSVNYALQDTSFQGKIDSTLQKITLSNTGNSYIKHGDPYTIKTISNELERLTTIYRQNGYYKFYSNNLYALIDTIDSKFLKLSIDPFEQIKLAAEAEKNKRENPKWDITILKKFTQDSAYNKQFHVAKIYYYPDLKTINYNADSLIQNTLPITIKYRYGALKASEDKFKLRPLREHTYLRSGKLYNEALYYKSISRLSQMGTWKQVDVKTIIRDNDSLDFHFFMLPEKKQGYTIDGEISRNTGDIGSGNLLGVATNFSYRNRNIWKQAIQSITTFRLGFEFNLNNNNINSSSNSVLQTTQFNISHTYSFPRLILPFNNWRLVNSFDNKRTLFNISGSYTDRKTFYQIRSFVANWGYEFTSAKNFVWLIKIPNIELYNLDTLPGLENLFQQNPFLRSAFRNGNVFGLFNFSVSKNFASPRNPTKNHFIRFGLEESGKVASLFAQNNNIFNYLKLEAEYRYLKKYNKTEFASRFFYGIGIPKSGQTLPIFKQYFMGGPNSMRAWGLRQLGLGSSKLIDTTTSGFSDRFGDLTLEANVEYRFPLAVIAGFKIGSALYTDMGNIWSINKQLNNPNASFAFSNLGKDLAIGVGTGIRVDFSYVIIRVDFAYKVKDPARDSNNGWMSIKNFTWKDTRQNGVVEISNYAFQLGIGLPF